MLAMEVAVVGGRPDVELLAPVATVGVTDDAEVLQDAQGPIDRRGSSPGIDCPTPFDQFAARHVTVSLGQDVEQESTLRRPSKATRTQVVTDRHSGRFDD
jgi:hypothetical protein